MLFIIIGMSLFLYFNYEKKEDVIQNVIPTPNAHVDSNSILLDLNDNTKKYELGRVDVLSFKVVAIDEHESHLILLLENTTIEDVDLTNDYKVYVYDKNDNYIVEYSGNALGKIRSNSKLECDIKIDFDKSIIGNVIIKKNSD